MAFEAQESRVPTSIGKIWHILIDNPSSTDVIRYSFEVLDQNGEVMAVRSGDEVPHLTQQQITAIQTFLNAQRALAEATLPD